MPAPLKPLRDCIRSSRDRVARDYDAASTDALFDLILVCDTKLIPEREDSARVDALRAISWFANAALTRRGLSPRARSCLGSIHIKSKRLLHDIWKQDAPYIDLQWLAFRYPAHLPPRFAGIKSILATASRTMEPDDGDDIVFTGEDRDQVLDRSFFDADRLINRRLSIARKCIALKLPPSAQAEMRWLCSLKTRQLLRELDANEIELRDKMRRQGIKQLTGERIDARVLTYRAWKLAGGGTNWQATADVREAMTGVRITRQAIKDMITRLSSQKLIRRRRGKTRTIEPIITK